MKMIQVDIEDFLKFLPRRTSGADVDWDTVKVYKQHRNNFTIVLMVVGPEFYVGVSKCDPRTDIHSCTRGFQVAANRVWAEYLGRIPSYGRDHKGPVKTLKEKEQAKKAALFRSKLNNISKLTQRIVSRDLIHTMFYGGRSINSPIQYRALKEKKDATETT